jgi:hypothetical protein
MKKGKPTGIQAAIDSTPAADLEEMMAWAEQYVAEHIIPDFIKAHQDPPRIRFYYLSLFVKPGHTRPFGRFAALNLDDALEAATRAAAVNDGAFANYSRRYLFRLDIVETCPDLDKQ